MRLGDFIKAIEMATAESELRLPDMHSGPPGPFWFQVPGMAVSGLLLIFCILEVFIASISAHFGCQLTCYQTNNVSPRGSSEDGKRVETRRFILLPFLPRNRRAPLVPKGMPSPSCFITGTLSVCLCFPGGRGHPKCLCDKPSGHPRTRELATKLFWCPAWQISKPKCSRSIFHWNPKEYLPCLGSWNQILPSLTI